jgi:hypothetical protein
MRQVLVQNTGTLAGTNPNPADVAVGQLRAFTQTGTPLDIFHATPASISAMPDAFFFVLGTEGNQQVLTNLLHKKNIHKVVKRAYVAPVPRQLSIAMPAGSAGAGIATIKVINDQNEFRQFQLRTYEVRIAAADTAAQVAGKFVTKIGQDSLAQVVATVSGNNLVLTSITAGEGLKVALEGLVEGAAITVVAAGVLGSGTPAQVRELQVHDMGNTGRYYLEDPVRGGYYEALPNRVLANGQYTLYTILHETPYELAINKSVRYQEITIAVNNGVTGTLDVFLGL